jgi:hypothetical protein
MTSRFCKRGHDTEACGRNKHGACLECVKIYEATRREKDRAAAQSRIDRRTTPRQFTPEEDALILSGAAVQELAALMDRNDTTIYSRRRLLLERQDNAPKKETPAKPEMPVPKPHPRFARPWFFTDDPEAMARRGR